MTTFNVIQSGSQCDAFVGTVDATSIEDAQMKAYAEYGNDNDRDAGYNSFRVEPKIQSLLDKFASGDPAFRIINSGYDKRKEIDMDYQSFEIGDVVTLTAEGFAAFEIAEWSGKTPLLLGKDYVVAYVTGYQVQLQGKTNAVGHGYLYNSCAFILSSFAEGLEDEVSSDVAYLSVKLGQRDAQIKRMQTIIDSQDADIKGLIKVVLRLGKDIA